jgi:hypothetical protein
MDEGTDARSYRDASSHGARWSAKATAVRPTHMQVIERVHASKHTWGVYSHQSAGEAYRSWTVALLLLPTKQAGQVSKPREMWVNDDRPGSPGNR